MRPRKNASDFEHSRNRWLDQDELRAKLTGWGTSNTGQAIRRKYRPRFEQRLAADRRRPQHKEIWRALKDAGRIGTDLATGQFLDRLMVMGITAAAGEGATRRFGWVNISALSVRKLGCNSGSVPGRLTSSTPGHLPLMKMAF